ncbi:MAG: PIN domain-containing protein, partial [Acidobacteriota bacterium]
MPADPRKVFVLDTSVILYDHLALNSFEEHDVAIPMTVLEELDRFKKGSAVINRNAREFIRRLDDYSGDRILQEWIPLNGGSSGRVRVVMPPAKDDLRADLAGLATAENDHKILASAMGLIRGEPDRRVVLVSKDINLRLKARALEMPAEDYKRVSIRDIDDLYRGKSVLEVDDPSIIDTLHREGAVEWRDVLDEEPEPNHFFILQNVQRSGLAWYNPRERRLERIIKHQAYGVDPRNAEQTFALHAILDPHIPLVTLAGAAGTGKTLIALAGALERKGLLGVARIDAVGLV